MKNNTTTIRIRHEATLTSNGTHHHGNCRPLVAVDMQKTFNSSIDFRTTYHVSKSSLYHALHDNNGGKKFIKVFEKDANGNKVCIGKTRVTFVAHMESSVDAMMECGRKSNEKLSKVSKENAELKHELSCYNKVIVKLNEKKKVKEKVERRKKIVQRKQEEYQLSLARLQEAERELNELTKEIDDLV